MEFQVTYAFVDIKTKKGCLTTTIYRNSTDTGRYLYYKSSFVEILGITASWTPWVVQAWTGRALPLQTQTFNACEMWNDSDFGSLS